MNPDLVLARYQNGQVQPAMLESVAHIDTRAKMPGDPLEKPGLIGGFNRAYSISEAIASFLPDVYEPSTMADRYTYVHGTTSGGAVVYQDKFLYSHHSTDPISGHSVNAFDLVRVHKFGDLDADIPAETPVNHLPSYQAMIEFAKTLPEVSETMAWEDAEDPVEVFAEIVDDDWHDYMDVDSKGNFLSTAKNVMLILENDPNLSGKLMEDMFSHRMLINGTLPWRKDDDFSYWSDRDESGLRNYLSMEYKIKGKGIVIDALNGFLLKHQKHPIRDFLQGLVWDGKERLDTLLIDRFGVADTPYSRAVTRKMFVAAVARVMTPGVKFDNILVLVGRQGIGKSWFLKKIGKCWFSDSFPTTGFSNKDAYEAIQGVWIIELGELAALKKADDEHIKHFLAKQSDRFRIPYDRNTSEFPRQCVFFGTTNRFNFLRDATGNRRYWPLQTEVTKPVDARAATNISEDDVDQVWAEAMVRWAEDEPLFLDYEIEALARREQEAHLDTSEKAGPISEFLEMRLPVNWPSMDLVNRRRYIHDELFKFEGETVERTKVCVLEVWTELFIGDSSNLPPAIRNEIKDILLQIPGWRPYTEGTGKLRFGKLGAQPAFVRAS